MGLKKKNIYISKKFNSLDDWCDNWTEWITKNIACIPSMKKNNDSELQSISFQTKYSFVSYNIWNSTECSLLLSNNVETIKRWHFHLSKILETNFFQQKFSGFVRNVIMMLLWLVIKIPHVNKIHLKYLMRSLSKAANTLYDFLEKCLKLR